MSKSLIITEKPSVARDITEAIGGFKNVNSGEYFESDHYVCTYAVGHILGLVAPEEIDPKYKRWRLADLPIVPQEFTLKPVAGQQNRVKIIAKLAKREDVTGFINACDAAREGELIFREIVDYLKTNKPIQRLWLQSMTKAAIREGFKELADGKEYEGLAAAAACRSYSDWLIGMNATRALTVRLKSRAERGTSWSAGRVQTPTLALLVRREVDILSHVPMPFFKIEASFKAQDHEYKATWFDPQFKRSQNEEESDARDDRIFERARADAIIEKTRNRPGLASETRKQKPRKPPLLFDLTSLQRDANRRFGWSAVRTLRAAQRCYEAHKVLTYPRTSSRVLPEDYKPVVDQLLQTLSETHAYGKHAQTLIDKGRQNESLVFNNEGVSDHFAIIPTGEIKELDGDDRKLFDLVTRQFLASFYPPAIYEEVERTTVVEGESFRSRPPQVLKEPGWQACFEKEKAGEEDVLFPPLAANKDHAENVKVNPGSMEANEQRTKPPARISEAGLLGLMENAGRQVKDEELAEALQKAEGLGTAATRADIIENLKVREYVDQNLRPTVKGIRLIDVLQRIKAETITSAELTAKLELHLSEVEEGKRSAQEFMDEVTAITKQVVEAAKNFSFEDIYPDTDALGDCPQCKSKVYERAWFYGCTEATKRSEERKTCDFLVWKDFYGRYLDRVSVVELLTKGQTRELDNFHTPNGKTYKAILVLEHNKVVRKPVEGSEQDANAEALAKLEVNPDPVGPCPIHKDGACTVIETQTEFLCTNRKSERENGNKGAEGYGLPRIICKREMKREDVHHMITTGSTPFLTGFISKRGRPFSARLSLQPSGGFQFEFPERAPGKGKKAKGAEESGAEASPAE